MNPPIMSKDGDLYLKILDMCRGNKSGLDSLYSLGYYFNPEPLLKLFRYYLKVVVRGQRDGKQEA